MKQYLGKLEDKEVLEKWLTNKAKRKVEICHTQKGEKLRFIEAKQNEYDKLKLHERELKNKIKKSAVQKNLLERNKEIFLLKKTTRDKKNQLKKKKEEEEERRKKEEAELDEEQADVEAPAGTAPYRRSRTRKAAATSQPLIMEGIV
mgnify:CR=1 FL=1